MSSQTSLDILVRAQDQATKVLTGVAASGKKIGTSLNAAGAQGSRAMTSVSKTTSTLGSTLRKIGGIIGIAFGVTAVYHFGKAAVAAFEAVEKQRALLEVGLQHIGMAGQLDPLVSQLGAVSDETVTLQATTDSVASAVLNVGHAYFETLGTQAPAVLAGLTKGILNTAAATHKSLGMLQRSLTLAIINTPAKAIPMLQKLGIISADQAVQFVKLAAAGDTAALTQAEVNAVTNAYPDSASASATASDRLAKSMDDIKVKVGQVLTPIVGVIAKMAGWAAKNTAVTASVLGGAGILFALTKLVGWGKSAAAAMKSLALAMKGVAVSAWTAVTGFVADTAALVALVAAEGAAAVGAMAVGDAFVLMGATILIPLGAALAAGLAIGTMLDHIFGISEKLSRMIVDNSMNEAGAIDAQVKAFGDLKAQWVSGQITAEEYTAGIDVLNAKYGSNIDAAGVMANATASIGQQVVTTATKVKRWAGMGVKAFRAWAKETGDSAASSIVSLGGVELATQKTAKAFVKSSALMAKVARQDAKAMKKLASKKQDWVNPEYVKWLTTLGPGAVANFEQLTKKSQQQAVADWKSTTKSSDAYGKSINSFSPAKVDAVTAASDRLNTSLSSVRAQSPINVDIYLRQHGTIPTHARGGDIPFPELAVVGEHGSELVALPGGSHVYPHGRRPAAGRMRADFGRVGSDAQASSRPGSGDRQAVRLVLEGGVSLNAYLEEVVAGVTGR